MGYQIPSQDATEVIRLLHTVYRASPPPNQGQPLLPLLNGYAQPIGTYLVTLGYISPRQLVMSLATQRRERYAGHSTFFGTLLIREQLISPTILATILTVQAVDRLLDPFYKEALRFGEILIAQNKLRPVQLAAALEDQISSQEQGAPVPIGQILMRQGVISKQDIDVHFGRVERARG